MTTPRVIIAMSGGVDSSVAAARLVDEGFDVVGVTLHLWDYPDEAPAKSRCCAPEDIHDARLVADHLGIPHYAFDRRELFAEQVVAPFVEAYLGGTTPSPCVWCNRSVKMGELFTIADRLGASEVATGHYARIVRDDVRVSLHRGRDPVKDQSYFLHMLRREQLARLRLPLGESQKAEVRAEAIARSLPGAEKGESQELCFVAATDYKQFVEERAGERLRPGPIVDDSGRRLGDHQGIHGFTVGQRRGLGVALGRPAFVRSIDPDGTVTVGDETSILARAARLDAGTWREEVRFPLAATVQVRARHEGAAGTIERSDDGLLLRFDEPVRAIAPGQIAVAYDGDRVLGGATILAPVALPSATMAG
ncbi:MAG: tRNA 2-thiouridine(34) synthase MnmA [Polyangiaceae bacterium]